MFQRMFVVVFVVPSALAAQEADSTRAGADTQVMRAGPEWVAPPRNVADLLTARFPGLVVSPSAGMVGAGSRLRVRGVRSLRYSSAPAVFVDGMPVDASEATYTLSLGGQSPSRLGDINPEDVASVEIIRGPSAGVTYGPDRANGVILLHTKRGRAEPPRWDFYAAQGFVSDPYDWPANFGGWDLDNSTPSYQTGGCTLEAQAQAACVQDFVRSFAPLERRSQFRTAPRRQAGLGVSGGTEMIRYAAGVDLEGEGGIYELSDAEAARLEGLGATVREDVRHPNHWARTAVRGALDLRPSATTELNLSLSRTSGDRRFVENDNTIFGFLNNGLQGSSDSTVNDGWRLFRPGELFQILSSQDVDRWIGSLRVATSLGAHVRVVGFAGLDRVDQRDFRLVRRDEGPDFGGRLGFVGDNRLDLERRTLRLEASAVYRLSERIGAETRVGIEDVADETDGVFRAGTDLPVGATTVDAAVNQSSTTVRSEAGVLGIYVEQDVAWGERVRLTAGLRRDDRDAADLPFGVGFGPSFGGASDAVVSPALSVSWSATRQRRGPLDALDIHAAYGAAPQWLAEPGGQAERVRELEIGARAGLWHGRVAASVTVYDSRTTDMVVAGTTTPGGFRTLINAGGMSNRGVEASFTARVTSREDLSWDLALHLWGNRNRVTDLGPVLPILGTTQSVFEDAPVAGYWAQPIVGVTDANGDGIVELSEIQLGALRWMGTPWPTQGASLITAVTAFGRVRARAQLDYRAGHHLLNQAAMFRCLRLACPELFVPGTPLGRQAAAVVARRLNLPSGFFEDADFLRMRELSLSVDAPPGLARAVRAGRLTFTLAGRNVFTLTGYSGLDPEVNRYGQGEPGGLPSALGVADFFTQPPVRYWTLRLDAEF